jgi:opacity protein-like surface antigen
MTLNRCGWIKSKFSLIALMVILLVIVSTLPALADQLNEKSVISLSNSFHSSTFSNNSTSIKLKENNSVSQAPKIMSIGKGYYEEHPVGYNSQVGQETWIKNKATGTSMKHEVESADNLTQNIEISGKDSSYSDIFGLRRNSGTQMNIKEDVGMGKVSIGVLQGGTTGDGLDPSSTALKNPKIDIEENYYGSFHIETNMSLQEPKRVFWLKYPWLPCCMDGYYPNYYGKYYDGKGIFA